ncbi:archease [Natronobacterium texcoconense]|uniref:SHS2 domain-containing protein n=1 Tax=Natronobacterium texcoconense TaxID=1095778 RepID=A0A1H1G660_NATTX|nr:archease [Natronobacterium texcoconense]SDR08398.1 SHS2 domain-containing protein [Natronobacterium texcoconense]
MPFELRDHTADIAVEATGETLEDVFAAVADGLAAASCETMPDDGDGRFSVSVTAERREALLFDYLDELVYLRDVRNELPVEHRVESIDESDGGDWSLEASARGIPLTEITAREIKAVTYSEMRLERVDDGWEAYVVFDV